MLLYITVILISAVIIFFAALFISVARKYSKRPLDRIYHLLQQQTDFCSLKDVPERYISLLICAEDKEFYQHHGICISAIREALKTNIKRKEFVIGGSTITQQLVKNLYFYNYKKIWRKLQEMLLAFIAERVLSKNELLEMYINIIYYGCGQFGITSASAYYFGKHPKDLTFNQIFLLIRIMNGPTKKNPLTYPEAYAKSRDFLVNLWEKEGVLSAEEAALILSYDRQKPDPELRDRTDEAERFTVVPVLNERYGCESGFGES